MLLIQILAPLCIYAITLFYFQLFLTQLKIQLVCLLLSINGLTYVNIFVLLCKRYTLSKVHYGMFSIQYSFSSILYLRNNVIIFLAFLTQLRKQLIFLFILSTLLLTLIYSNCCINVIHYRKFTMACQTLKIKYITFVHRLQEYSNLFCYISDYGKSFVAYFNDDTLF